MFPENSSASEIRKQDQFQSIRAAISNCELQEGRSNRIRPRLEYGNRKHELICKLAVRVRISYKTLVLVFFGLVYDLSHANLLTIAEWAQFYFILLAEGFAAMFLLGIFFCSRRLYHGESTFARFLSRVSESLQMNPEVPDGVEVYLTPLMALIFGVSCAVFPLSLLLIRHQVHVFALASSSPAAVKLLLAAVTSSEIFLDWLAVFHFVSLLLVYSNCMRRTLSLLKCQPDDSLQIM